MPKAAVITHERVWAASFLQAVCGVTSEDIFYINLPLYHSAGFLIGMTGAIERGNNPLNPLMSIRTKVFAQLIWAIKKLMYKFTLRQSTFYMFLIAGMTIVLRRKFSASQFWEDCRKYNVTVMQYIGETMRYLCNTPKVKGNLSNLRLN